MFQRKRPDAARDKPQAAAPAAKPAPGRAPGPAGQKQAGLPGVGAIIAVGSGKGGVGKSTTAINLALGLQALGLRVGMLDADVYGPSLPRLLGLVARPTQNEDKTLNPLYGYGMTVMSMGFLVEEANPVIWRGAMVIQAITQMLKEVRWGTLDVLVVDMPPGTGDVQLTLAQQVPLAGAVIVSTPQDVALLDAKKGLAMFRQVNVPILGLIENMSVFVCGKCGHEDHIFGQGGVAREAERLGLKLLGAVPLELAIRERSDAGQPITASDPNSSAAERYRAMAADVWAIVQTQASGRKPPQIIFEQ